MRYQITSISIYLLLGLPIQAPAQMTLPPPHKSVMAINDEWRLHMFTKDS